MRDFSECEFIENEMWFYTFDDFCNQCFGIKRLFKRLPKNGQLFYRWYVYANTHMDLQFKNAIWDFLQLDECEKEMYQRLIKLEKRYKTK